jgi:predicted 3-demethylubiquinone-9 3-methyltransferase (glyoxalase superfamily)
MPSIAPCLWFDGRAEEAATFYTELFPNSKITNVVRAPGSGTPGNEPGSVVMVEFTLDGQPFAGLNGGPQFKFTEAVSFQIHVADQPEVDHYWDAFTDGGEPGQCSWCKDRFGLSWQVVPKRLLELLGDPDAERSQRAFTAMMSMTKIDVAAVEAAVNSG